MNWKRLYTKMFLKELKLDDDEHSVDAYIPLWWKNTRDKGKSGLRLSDLGVDTVEKIGIVTYEIKFPKDMEMTTQVIIFLDKFIDCPYYLKKSSIVVTGERKAIELHLFSGDVKKYGHNKAMRRQKSQEQ